MSVDPQHVAFALDLADAARDVLRDRVSAPPSVSVKPDSSLVTDLDHAVEDRLRAMIERRFPEHGIVGEERGVRNPGARHAWVLDPIDGTAQFVAGLPVFGTLIALAESGTPILGVVDHLMTDVRWVGARGAATTLNGRAVATRPCPGLDTAMLSCGNPDHFGPAARPVLEALKAHARCTVYGGGCYAYGQLASGRIDLAFDDGLDAVDICALVPVVQGAGGVISDWQGRPLSLERTGRVLAAGSRDLHERAMEAIARATDA